jgi:hypothetical protein
VRTLSVFRRVQYSLDDIEHGCLRANQPHPGTGARTFEAGDPRLAAIGGAAALPAADARVHFALVCGARSCQGAVALSLRAPALCYRSSTSYQIHFS